MEMKYLKDTLIHWIDHYIDYNADIQEWKPAPFLHHITNRHELAKGIIDKIFDELSDTHPDDLEHLWEAHKRDTNTWDQHKTTNIADQQLDQELDQLWEKVKTNLLDQHASTNSEDQHAGTNIGDQPVSPTCLTNAYDQHVTDQREYDYFNRKRHIVNFNVMGLTDKEIRDMYG